MIAPRSPSVADISRALGLAPDASLQPRPGTRPWYANLVAYDIADSLRSLGLPCAARACTADATPETWREIDVELSHVAVAYERSHEVRACRSAARMMAERCSAAAATDLQRLRGHDTLEQWSAEVRAEMDAAGVRL